MTVTTPRLVIRDFAVDLEATLTRNDAKKDWADLDTQGLLDLLAEEMAELAHELRQDPASSFRVGLEALDLAACAMFAWDRARGGAASSARGRA